MRENKGERGRRRGMEREGGGRREKEGEGGKIREKNMEAQGGEGEM